MIDALDEAFPLSAQEQHRLAHLPSPASSEDWLAFASSVNEHLLKAYEAEEIDFKRLMELARSVSLGCTTASRIHYLGYVADRGLSIKPRIRNARKPIHPTTLKIIAVELVEWIKSRWPDAPLPVCIDVALAWLISLRLFEKQPNDRTLRNWYIRHRAKLGRNTPRGRPRKAKIH